MSLRYQQNLLCNIAYFVEGMYEESYNIFNMSFLVFLGK